MKLRFNTVKDSCSLETINNDFRCALEVVIELNHPSCSEGFITLSLRSTGLDSLPFVMLFSLHTTFGNSCEEMLLQVY